MTKKIWLFIISFIGILWFWVSFADLISPHSHRARPTILEEKCIMFESVEVGNWRIISFDKNLEKVKEEHAKECINYNSNTKFYILDYNIDVNDILIDNIEDKAEKITVDELGWFYESWSHPIRHEYIYQIILNWSGLYEAKRIWENRINLEEENKVNDTTKFEDFIYAWIITVLVETLLLFLIAKFCWKSWSLKNRKIIITWILASTITLPLLRFVLPIFFSNLVLYVILWEILVTVIETFIIKYSLKIDRKMAIFASIVCNLFSFLVWLFIFYIFPKYLEYSRLSWSRKIHFDQIISEIILKIRNSWIYTVLLEPIMLLIILKSFRNNNETSKKRIFLIWFLASLLTLPLLWFILPYFLDDKSEYIIFWIMAMIELFIIKYWLKIWRWKAIILSIICNLFSYSIREFLTYLS